MAFRSVCRALGVVGLGLMTVSGASAQGFDEGSFETPSGGASAPVNQPSGSDTGGFGESSFAEGGFAPESGTVFPQPGGQAEPANESVAAASSDGDGFGESSFEEGGSTVAAPDATSPGPSNPAGGDDFPGGTTVPEPGGGGIVDGTPVPEQTSPGDQPPSPNATPPGPRVDPQITAVETRDFGVPPQSSLRQGQFHGPTPVAIPGAYLVTTESLVDAMTGGMQMVLIDVLGADYSIPGAYSAQGLAAPGTYQDRTQQQAAAWLRQITGGTRDLPIVLFCSDPMCWLSYNAALRTVNAGYTNVYWYRGGLQAWQMAGLPLHPAGF